MAKHRPMSPRCKFKHLRPLLRRSLVGLCVLAHLAVTTGLPVPQLVEVDVTSAAFPCQHHHCGCRTAEHCWRSCCCMSTQQKLAWAKQHGVTPPDYALAAAAADDAAVEINAAEDSADEGSASCCASRKSARSGGCCSSTSGDDRQAASRTSNGNREADNSRRSTGWLPGIQAQKCQGISTLWLVSGAVLPPPPLVEAPVDSAPPQWRGDTPPCRWQAVSSPPDVPPPQLA